LVSLKGGGDTELGTEGEYGADQLGVEVYSHDGDQTPVHVGVVPQLTNSEG